MNINKKTNYFFGLFTVICFFANGQSSLPISGIEVLEQYQSVLSKGDFNNNSIASSFQSLFFYNSNKTVVMDDIGDFEKISLVNLSSYIDSMRVFNQRFLIDTVIFSNYNLEKISKKKNYTLIQVSVDKKILYKYKTVTRSTAMFKETKNASLVFTVISYKGSEFQPLQSRILKISDYVDRDNFIIPENFEISAGYLSPDLVSEFIKVKESNGFNARLKANYLIAGKNNLSLYLSPGIAISNLNITKTLPGGYIELQEKDDNDGYGFSDSITFNGINQETNIKLFSIPLKLNLLWYLNKNWHVGINSGLIYNFPISSNSVTNNGSLTHVGIYNFANNPGTYRIGDLDSYGFGDYAVEDIKNTIGPNSFLSAPIGFNIGFKPEKMNFAVTANIEYNVGLTSITSDDDFLAGFKGEIKPLYANDATSKINELSFNLGVKYYFSEPRIPYYRNIYKKEIKSRVQSLKEIESTRIVFNETLQSATLNLFVNKPANLKEIKKLTYYVEGTGVKNKQKGKIKVGPKSNTMKLKIPVDQMAKEECKLLINKPFGYNIFSRGDSVY
ncbi:MAG: hypothetical protein HOG79_16705, partial [Prolixibacteraceae bacterium]|nr:hypothetical protein [Prolixibacteraceae bacterium]